MHKPMPEGPRPVCPTCGTQLVWDSKWIEWYCDPCEESLDSRDDDENLTSV